MLPNSSSSDIPLELGSNQAFTHSKGVTKVMIDYPENEVINIIEKIKMAKDSENTVEGYISKDTNFRSNKSRESFLFDTGATVCIIGLEVAKDNNLKISKLTSPRNIIKASGAQLEDDSPNIYKRIC